MASSLESPTFHWKRDEWVTTPPPKSIEKSVVATSLDGAHQVVFKRAMTNILATELAELTFAQLIDGLPLWDVAMDQSRKTHTKEEPVYNHKQLCDGAMEKMLELREQFDPLAMEVRADTLDRYQNTPVGSRVSKLPLVELIAVALHELAVHVFKKADGGFHKYDKYPDDTYYEEKPFTRKRKPTPFLLWLTFDEPNQLPDGVADIAAYWAEDRIFGGVVLFGRGKSGRDQNGVWFHSHRRGVTENVYALSEDQIASLTHFLESSPGEANSCCPLPILANRDNKRQDYRLSMPKYKIYRDPWERKMMYGSYLVYRNETRNCRMYDIDPIERPEWNGMDSGSDSN
ncbi:hypothetical protein J7T55_003439 [Diaporthe amygdali]|uniref:uncharacterized protein n=1 Tax=Phomopsis amygdali TaxID=1214568 RepID=UPI0022FE54F0|nr:uncharacterized protein J7T55_003439 [Diaporthe amygdali]KAJ0117023.1 hypothetical protein J7T55_003439 [Diaporthe amygdali]